MANIIILNGSPRKNGNTAQLIKAFTEGAQQAGHIVTIFSLQQMNIKGCIGCFGGGKNPESPCTQKDDMEKIYPVYEEADIIVFASPMYFWGITGQLKTALDRLFAVSEKYPDFHAPGKKCILLMAAGDATKENDEPVEQYYHSLVKNMGWTNLGLIIAGEVNFIGDIEGHIALQQARDLAMTL